MEVVTGVLIAAIYILVGLLAARWVVHDWIGRFGTPHDIGDHAALGFIVVGVLFFWWVFLVIIALGYAVIEIVKPRR